jgi:hypothetical protein
MKPRATLFVGAIFCCALTASAFAQSASDKVGSPLTWTKPDGTKVTLEAERGSVNLNADELHAFQAVKDADASVETQLAEDPKLVASDSYVSQHPALQQFLEQYPHARAEIQANPGNFLTPVAGSTWNASVVGDTRAPGSK